MPDSFSIDLRHFLDDDGMLPSDLPNPARRLALHNAAIVSWVTAVGPDPVAAGDTNVVCRRSHAKRPCFGTINAALQAARGTIGWRCSDCGEEGVIDGWEGTRWDRRRPDA